MRAVTCVVFFAAAVSFAASPPLRLAVPGLQGVNVAGDQLGFYAEHLAQNLRAPGLTVVTSREIATLLGLERQRALLDCQVESSSCLAELANALGADAVVLGDVARFDDTFQFNVKVVAASDASVLAQGSRRVRGQVETLDGLADLARELGRGVLTRKGLPIPAELRAASGSDGVVRRWSWLPMGAGVVAAAAGGVLLFLAQKDYDALTGPGAPLSEPDSKALRDGGASKQVAGVACLAVGLTVAAAGAGMFLLGGPAEKPLVTLAPTPGGLGLVVSGSLP